MKKKRLPLCIVRDPWQLHDAGNQAPAGTQHAGRAGAGQRIYQTEILIHQKVIPETDCRQAQLKCGAAQRAFGLLSTPDVEAICSMRGSARPAARTIVGVIPTSGRAARFRAADYTR